MTKYSPIIEKCNHDNIFAIAGQSAFFIILSAVPLSMFLVSILQYLNIPVAFIEEGLSGIFSENLVNQTIDYITTAYNNSVGVSFITLLCTLWSAAQGLHSITNGLNRVYDAYENRTWITLRLRSMIYTIILFAIIIVLLMIIVLGTTLNNWLLPLLRGLPESVNIIYNLRYIIIFIFLVIVFALIYRNFPNISRQEHKEYKFKYQLPGAVLCAMSWFALSLGISIYVDDFNGFSIYGGLTRLAVIMIWIYFCMVCLMVCAEINYVYHEQIKNNTLRTALKKLFTINKSSYNSKK